MEKDINFGASLVLIFFIGVSLYYILFEGLNQDTSVALASTIAFVGPLFWMQIGSKYLEND